MIYWSLVPPLEPKVRPAEVILTSKNILKILKTIKPVIKAFTAMDAVRPVVNIVSPQAAYEMLACTYVIEPSDPSQVARGDKLKSAY